MRHTAARQAAGSGLSGTMTIANGAAGHTDFGQHVFGFVSQTVSGYNAPPTILKAFVTVATNSVSFGSVMDTINNYAFAGGTCPNPTDPIIIHLRIKIQPE